MEQGKLVVMENKKKISIKNIILLQAVVVIYTLNSIIAKFATGAEVFSLEFILFYGAEVAVLGVYAICWQQMIKKFDLSIAYANRAMAILWTALWAMLIFKNNITLKQGLGIALVVIGTVVVNLQSKDEKAEESSLTDIYAEKMDAELFGAEEQGGDSDD